MEERKEVAMAAMALLGEKGSGNDLDGTELMKATRIMMNVKNAFLNGKLIDKGCTEPPHYYRYPPQQKEEEFLKLVQNDMTVAQYEAKFTSLSRYTPHLVDTKNHKARRFEKGLKRGIKNILLALKLSTYAKVVERAKILETDYGEGDEKTCEEPREVVKWGVGIAAVSDAAEMEEMLGEFDEDVTSIREGEEAIGGEVSAENPADEVAI
ncbi:hypothetical protein RJ639_008780 [Escallonia herrerae]|uniref:Retrotransposon gag domain-containing protein n=1 Tax=Escallonia herrerae TaxID=1293975 RepID=A0AA88VVP7_9ASTE|nr:hypothetical protein RJ639_008780 [Escallonia herrerae]